MYTVSSAFEAFDHALNLDPQERALAQERHIDLRSTLEASGLVSSTFLQGSFARKTMLKPLKDVDIVVLLGPGSGFEGSDGPGRAMSDFRRIVEAKWPTAEFDAGEAPSAKALRIEFVDLSFTFDLVPAHESVGDWVEIGDREKGVWELSNTRIQRNKVAERNVSTHGAFVHQVRMLKSFVRTWPRHNLDFIKGIAVESIAFNAIDVRMPNDEAMACVLRHGATRISGPVIEPAGHDDVSLKWTVSERETAIGAFEAGAIRAEEALALRRAGDERAAISVWSDVFGLEYPSPPTQATEELLKSWASGSLTSSGRPSRTGAGALSVAPGRAWRN